MKKLDYKKLALMGIAGGALIAAQAQAHTPTSSNETVVAGSCGGSSRPNGTTKGNSCNSSGCSGKVQPQQQTNGGSCANNGNAPRTNGGNNPAPRTKGSSCGGSGCQHKNGNGAPAPAPTDKDTTDGAANATPGKTTRVSAGCKSGSCGGNKSGKGGKLTPDDDQTAMQTKRANLQGGGKH